MFLEGLHGLSALRRPRVATLLEVNPRGEAQTRTATAATIAAAAAAATAAAATEGAKATEAHTNRSRQAKLF